MCSPNDFIGGRIIGRLVTFSLTLAVGAFNHKKNSSSTSTRPGHVWSSTHRMTLYLRARAVG